ncbi:MAG TPA: PIN domain nuclease [Actinophytocola sp.]|uniref:PIN domain nuclease n=1 Tax=Actinophytocola sp. TaxID=1872138 RepID=UPI002DDD56A1|nr:PIN domain nuclease [Actinophytocola sp.]HEV2783499.1 PIN domain nuclease [Actinophytocola sp.]
MREVVSPLLARRGLATCAVVDLEVLYSARSPTEYQAKLTELRANYISLPITPAICARAIHVQARLAMRSRHRGCGAADLLVAACGELHGVPILHYDKDYDLIASITGQPAKWVVPRGSVP